MINFNKPYFTGKETVYIEDAVRRGKISGNGYYTKKCQLFFEEKYNIPKTLLTTSCTDALEMAAILIDVKPGDEIIMPSYTFVSTANAFILRGAKIIFADSHLDNPNIDETKIESLITSKTKAIVPVHYAGVACEMDTIMEIAFKYKIYVIEDAAQAINSFYKGRPLGSIGDLATFSFHETKNIISGEGGLLAINNSKFSKRAEIIWEKGTNRASFFRGEVNKYGWVDVGSSFLPSEVIAAFLWAQFENLDNIQNKRIEIWSLYNSELSHLNKSGYISIPKISDNTTNNAHMFYIVCNSIKERCDLIEYLKNNGISSVFHYLSLHKSDFYKFKHDERNLLNCDSFSDKLLRLPFYYELSRDEIKFICSKISSFYTNNY